MELTHDTLLGGGVKFSQPRRGYRAAVDPVLLAAAVPVKPGERVLDLGCGAGAVSLCLMWRVADIRVTGVEIDPEMAALAKLNAENNGVAERFEIETADFTHLPTQWEAEAFDHVVFNPPYLQGERADPSPVTSKQLADIEGEADLRAWVIRAHRCLKRRTRISMVHRADRLHEIIDALEGFGEIAVLPIFPKQRVDAKRVIVTARKDVKAPFRLAAGLYLHDGEAQYTKRAEAILNGSALDFV
jgi:tRNA1(Val) A37 N6-methylase TrmN6